MQECFYYRQVIEVELYNSWFQEVSKEKELDKLIKENEGSLRKIQNFYLDQAQRVLKLTPKPQEIHTAA